MIRIVLIIGLFAAGVGIGWKLCDAQHISEAQRKTDALRTLTTQWLTERDARLDLERQLDDAARQDPDAARPAIGAASVRRLDSIR